MEHKIAAARVNRLFTHCLEQLEQHAATTSPRLSDAQNALLAYLRLDKIAEDEGFAMLIALGYGEELLCDQFAEQLATWGVPVLPDIVLQARGLYRELGAAIEQHGDAATVREAFPQFAVVDGILWSARRFFRRFITMCAGILMSLWGCWIFRLPDGLNGLGNKRALWLAF